MESNPDQAYLEELEKIEFHPVFILGMHRSGTSILYKILTATGSFNAVTAYHLIKYHELLSNHHHGREQQVKQEMTDFFKKMGMADRKIDTLQLTANFAEEYGFLLAKKTMQMYLTPKNISLFIELCKKIQVLAANEKPILLKNPYDFPNFLFLKKMFPTAKFVFIHRHPFRTISSARKALDMVFQDINPYTRQLMFGFYEKFYHPIWIRLVHLFFSRIPVLNVIILTRITKQWTTYYLKNIEKLPAKDYIAVTYEEFCRQPQNTIKRIMDALSIPLTNPIDAASEMNPRTMDLDPGVKKLRVYITKSMKQYLDRFGYSSDGL